MRLSYRIGNVLAFVSMVLLFKAISEDQWAYDAVNGVNMGLWYLTGLGVQYKLINAGLSADLTTNERNPVTSYKRFCTLSIVAGQDPWCRKSASVIRVLMTISLLFSIANLFCSMFRGYEVKVPTWDGAGWMPPLTIPVLLSVSEVVNLLVVVILWHNLVVEMDTSCKLKTGVQDFACVTASNSYTLMIVEIPLVVFMYIVWRLTNAYEHAKRLGKITDGFTLHAKMDNVDGILSGIANKIDIDALGSDGRNALHWACTLNRSSICHVLIKKGADLSKQDREGWTPLHWAARVGNLDGVRFLARNGADVNCRDRWGLTPLMVSGIGENRAAIELLLELNAQIDMRNVFGQTALMILIEAQPDKLFQLAMVFLHAGANLAIHDNQGNNSFHYAAIAGNRNLLINMLQLNGDPTVLEKRNRV